MTNPKPQSLKKAYLILLALGFSTLLLAQQPKTATDSIAKINYDSLLKKQQDLVSDLTRKIDVQSTVLTANAAFFTTLSTIFTLIGILVALIAIGMPLANYFFVWKPGRLSLKKLATLEATLPERIDREFDNFLANSEKRTFKKAIANLTDPLTRGRALDTLFLSKYNEIDEDDIKNVVDFLATSPDLSTSDMIWLHPILKSFENAYSERYYKGIIENEDDKNLDDAIKYFVKFGLQKYMVYFQRIIKSAKSGRRLFITIFHVIDRKYLPDPMDRTAKTAEDQAYGEKQATILLNDKAIVDLISAETYDKRRRSWDYEISVNRINWSPFIKDTYYYQKVMAPPQTEPPEAIPPSVDPTDAPVVN